MKIDYDDLAREYAQHRCVHPGVLAGLLTRSQVTSASRVLEVGCGTGNYIIAIEKSVGCSCVGIDPSEKMLAQARERSQQVQFDPGKAESLAFPEASFDLVFSVDVIHHVENRAAYYREAARVLKPGGLVCTVTDSEDIIRRRQPLANYFPETVELELVRYPRIQDLQQMMAAAGFEGIIEELVEYQTTIQDIQVYRDKAFSSLHLIPQETFERGILRMETDLLSGPIQVISRYLLLWGEKAANHA
jgi:ubiquinone/menaquinone biosynthesis C-methylase UbiE